MKKEMKKLLGMVAGLVTIAIMLITLATSCKKSDNNDNMIFQGTYIGTLSMGFYSEADTIIVTPGATSSSVMMTSQTGTGSTFTINGTVSGAKLTIPAQSVYDSHMNTTYTVSGTGTLSNNNNSLLIDYTYVTSSSTTYYWEFSGTKTI